MRNYKENYMCKRETMIIMMNKKKNFDKYIDKTTKDFKNFLDIFGNLNRFIWK